MQLLGQLWRKNLEVDILKMNYLEPTRCVFSADDIVWFALEPCVSNEITVPCELKAFCQLSLCQKIVDWKILQLHKNLFQQLIFCFQDDVLLNGYQKYLISQSSPVPLTSAEEELRQIKINEVSVLGTLTKGQKPDASEKLSKEGQHTE